ncbi:MAG: DUF2278 family protein [Chitinophagaceae bacterium]|nr:DUF2278 family protein [Chitinophagaceae bacterium]
MPLNRYGVLIGTKTNYFRDAPDNFGKFYHGNIEVTINGIPYRCAIDVDSQVTRVQWRIIEFTVADLAASQQWEMDGTCRPLMKPGALLNISAGS